MSSCTLLWWRRLISNIVRNIWCNGCTQVNKIRTLNLVQKRYIIAHCIINSMSVCSPAHVTHAYIWDILQVMTCNVEKMSSKSALKFLMLSQTGLQETLSLTQSGRSSAAEPSRCWGGGEGRWADGWEGRGGCVVSLRSGRGLYLSTLTLAVSLLRGTSAIIAAANQPIRARLCDSASQKSHVSGREWLTV